MAWCNNYARPPAVQLTDEELYGPEPYDFNFCLPIDVSAFENDLVKLTPYIPRLHAEEFYNTMSANPELYRYLPFHPPKSLRDLLVFYEIKYRRDPTALLFVVIDKTRPPASGREKPGFEGGSFAGTIGFIRSSDEHLITEIGHVVLFPDFQRTHVHSNASGLLLHHCLNLPSDSPPGIGLRRVQWYANSLNTASISAAKRLGFQYEATHRWYVAMPEGKEGHTPRPGDQFHNKPGRDTVNLSICWDDWEAGTREKVQKLMEFKAR